MECVFGVCVWVFSRSTVVCVVRKYQFPPDPIPLISCCLYLSLLWFALTVNKLSLWFESLSTQEQLLQSHTAGRRRSRSGFEQKLNWINKEQRWQISGPPLLVNRSKYVWKKQNATVGRRLQQHTSNCIIYRWALKLRCNVVEGLSGATRWVSVLKLSGIEMPFVVLECLFINILYVHSTLSMFWKRLWLRTTKLHLPPNMTQEQYLRATGTIKKKEKFYCKG